MICVAISSKSQIEAAVKSGCSLMELRLDLIGEEPGNLFNEIPPGLKIIATYRPGGQKDEKRLDVLKTCMDLGASYVDVEVDSPEGYLDQVRKHAGLTGCGLIVSYHDFEGTPSTVKLNEILEECYRRGGVIAKIATMVHTREEVYRLLSLYGKPGRKVILGMGQEGRITRVAAPYLGSEFTFASVDDSGGTAPGQFNVEELKNVYRMIGGHDLYIQQA
jgi:3-dehydroquinate dehydratase I